MVARGGASRRRAEPLVERTAMNPKPRRGDRTPRIALLSPLRGFDSFRVALPGVPLACARSTPGYRRSPLRGYNTAPPFHQACHARPTRFSGPLAR